MYFYMYAYFSNSLIIKPRKSEEKNIEKLEIIT